MKLALGGLLHDIGKFMQRAGLEKKYPEIKLETALHIGGSEEGFDIGGLDNPVIKDKVTGVPYITI